MGRKTYESIGRALPGRRTIVLTRDRSYAAPDVEIVTSFDDALALVADVDRAFVAGGREVYSHALNVADELYLTVVHEVISGDTRFPHIDFMQWSLLACERHAADTRNAFPHTFLSYERRSRR
jgi:dihydrofolate reductase